MPGISMLNRELRTNGRLWALCTFAAFVLLGFFDPLPRIKGQPGSLWHWFADLLCGDAWAMKNYGAMLGCAVFLVTPIAALIGWILHGIVVAGLAWFWEKPSEA